MKKEKREALSSRRRRTARRILVAAAAVFLVNRIFLIGLVFPLQAIRQIEEREDTGRTAVVNRDWAPEIHRAHLIYLTENEKVTMLSGAYLTVYGWMGGFGVPLDCTGAAPIHGGWWSMGRYGGESVFYVFGRIDDPEIDFIKVQVQYEDWETGAAVRRTTFEWGSPREDWMEKGGRHYFLFRKSPMSWSEYRSPVYPVALGYDKEGNEIARVELDQGASSYFG